MIWLNALRKHHSSVPCCMAKVTTNPHTYLGEAGGVVWQAFTPPASSLSPKGRIRGEETVWKHGTDLRMWDYLRALNKQNPPVHVQVQCTGRMSQSYQSVNLNNLKVREMTVWEMFLLGTFITLKKNCTTIRIARVECGMRRGKHFNLSIWATPRKQASTWDALKAGLTRAVEGHQQREY